MSESKLFNVKQYWEKNVSSDVNNELVKGFGYHLDWYWRGITTLKQCSHNLAPLFDRLAGDCKVQKEADLFEATMTAVDHEFSNFDDAKHIFTYEIQENGVGGAIILLVFGSKSDKTSETEQMSALV